VSRPTGDAGEARRLVAAVAGRIVDDADAVDELYARAAWSCLVEPGDGVAGALVAEIGAPTALRALLAGALDRRMFEAADVSATEAAKALARWTPRLDPAAFDFALQSAARVGVRLLVPGDDAWPVRVDDLGPHAPIALWVRGDPAAVGDRAPAVAIVGARAASGYGEHVAGELAAEMAGRGATVVSGAAYGIDGVAHRAALAAGGTTVALLAGGADRSYPSGHAALLDRVARGGAIVSEVPCGSAPTKWRFLQRNRLIAALSDATVVVEAGRRSGSLNTASHAAALGRPLGAVPGAITSAASAGCHRLLRERAAQCITCADDVGELLGLAGRDGPASDPDRMRTDDRARILDALSARTARDVDDVARRSGMSGQDARDQLGVLALDGIVIADGGGWRRAATDRIL
jgi:DNA processing protein